MSITSHHDNRGVTIDVLEQWNDCIQNAHSNHSLSRGDEDVCILDLEEEVQERRAEVASLKKRVAELETQCDRCGLRLSHSPLTSGPQPATIITNTPPPNGQVVTYYPLETKVFP